MADSRPPGRRRRAAVEVRDRGRRRAARSSWSVVVRARRSPLLLWLRADHRRPDGQLPPRRARHPRGPGRARSTASRSSWAAVVVRRRGAGARGRSTGARAARSACWSPCWSGWRSSLGFLVWNYADQDVGSPARDGQPAPRHGPHRHPAGASARSPACLCERAGVINIAIEGQFLMGAFFASVVASLAVYSAEMGLLGGIAAGVAMARDARRLRAALPGQPGGARRRADRARDRADRLPARARSPTTRRSSSTSTSRWIAASGSPIPGLAEHPGRRAAAVQPDAAGLPDVRLGRRRGLPALPDPVGAAGPLGRRAPRRPPTPSASRSTGCAGRRCCSAACSPGSAAPTSPSARPAPSTTTSPPATASSRSPR